MTIEWVEISTLKPNPKNPNKHSEEQITRLAALIRFQGWRHPIIVSEQTGFIVAGHGRLSAAKKLGLSKVPITIQSFLSEEQEYAFLVSDNAIASWAELDLASINLEVPGLGPDFDIDMLGLKDFTVDMAEHGGGNCDEDEVPEPPKKAKAKRGDLFELGAHRLICGDSTSKTDVERLMDGQRAALWASDPPYGINHVATSQEKSQSKGFDHIANDDLEFDALKEFLEKVIKLSIEVALDDKFAFYMWHAMKMQSYAAAAAAAAGILFHRQIIWVKPSLVFGRGHYHWRHELCLMGWRQGNEPPFYGARNQTTVWELGRENDKIHPTQKPVTISEIPINNHTKPGQSVYEPFAGSGSTLIACEKTGRKCFALEIAPDYSDVIVQRWQAYTGKQAYRLNPDGTKLAWDDIEVLDGAS